MELQEFLVWLLSGGGAGVIAYWLMENVPFLFQLQSEYKRYVSLALSAGVAILAYLAAVGLQYEPQPETVKAWIESVFSVIALAIGFGQAIHGRLKMRIQA